jgi:hypothetical protein
MEHFTNEQVLEKLKVYVEKQLHLENSTRDDDLKMIMYDNSSFWFSRVDENDERHFVDIEDILKSCNNVESEDDRFIDSEDLIEELNSMVESQNITKYIVEYLENKFEVKCCSF